MSYTNLRSLIREMAVQDPVQGKLRQFFKASAEMCRELGERQILIREFQSSSPRGYHYVTTEGLAERGRMALRYKQEPTFRAFIDELSSRWGLGSVVYCASIGGRAARGMFGPENIVIPTEPHKVIWSDEVGDSGSWLNGDRVGTQRIPRDPGEVPAAVESYTEGWPPSDLKLEEVILDAQAYYLIGREWLAESVQRESQFRRGVPRSKGPVVSSRQQEEDQIAAKYGMKPRLRDAQASVKDHVMAARTYADLVPYLEWMVHE